MTRELGPARERLIEAAYELFSRHGTEAVGVDTIVARSGCAKASLYYNFGSKDGLTLAFLELRAERWARHWLFGGAMRRADTAEGRLLAIFDVLDEWFRREDYEACSFVRTLLTSAPGSPVHQAAAKYLAEVRGVLRDWAAEAGLAAPDSFAHGWKMLIKGAAVTAYEGEADAAVHAKRAGEAMLASWARA